VKRVFFGVPLSSRKVRDLRPDANVSDVSLFSHGVTRHPGLLLGPFTSGFSDLGFFRNYLFCSHNCSRVSCEAAEIKNEWRYTFAPLYAFLVYRRTNLLYYIYDVRMFFVFILTFKVSELSYWEYSWAASYLQYIKFVQPAVSANVLFRSIACCCFVSITPYSDHPSRFFHVLLLCLLFEELRVLRFAHSFSYFLFSHPASRKRSGLTIFKILPRMGKYHERL
jgi:hypothetical protein